MRITDKYVFFWVNADVYSNWHKSQFYMNGQRFANSEQAMMYEKAKLMGDREVMTAVLATTDPKEIKALGRTVAPWDQIAWECNRLHIMTEVCYAKFTSTDALRNELLSTGNRTIVEASPYDTIWGIGMKENDEGVDDPENWNGLNLLGIALMNVRTRLKEETNL